jgi:hypothetical protein
VIAMNKKHIMVGILAGLTIAASSILGSGKHINNVLILFLIAGMTIAAATVDTASGVFKNGFIMGVGYVAVRYLGLLVFWNVYVSNNSYVTSLKAESVAAIPMAVLFGCIVGSLGVGVSRLLLYCRYVQQRRSK